MAMTSACKQCHRVLESPSESSSAAGRALGESYVLLPTAISPRGVRSAFESLTQSMLHEPWEPTGSALDTPSRHGSRGRTDGEQHFYRMGAAHGHRAQDSGIPDSMSLMDQSASMHVVGGKQQAPGMSESVVAMATHADLSEHVQRLQWFHAHCAGAPVTSPACEECVDAMLKQIDGQAETARADKRSFVGFLQSSSGSTRQDEMEQLQEKLRFYEEELASLSESLTQMETERGEIMERQEALETETSALMEEEDTLWHAFNALAFDGHAFRECRDRAQAQLSTMEHVMAATRGLNVLTDAFVISQSGPFGTINGFRMGLLPNAHVEWNEINAALGEAALLLNTLADAVGLVFADFKIVPVGSTSKVIRITSLRMEYCLHGSDHDCFPESHFNLGLGAWLTCLAQLMSHVGSHDRSIRLPYKVSKHSIGGNSVLFLKKRASEWTKALRYALTNLKWLLAWISTRSRTLSATEEAPRNQSGSVVIAATTRNRNKSIGCKQSTQPHAM